jgi:hypothetical protein
LVDISSKMCYNKHTLPMPDGSDVAKMPQNNARPFCEGA